MANVHAVTFHEIQSIVSTLKNSLTSGYGPSFQHTVISTSAGKVLITNNGTDILNTFDIAHPLAQYVISCVRSCHQDAGDHSKTFVIILNELLYRAEKVVGTSTSDRHGINRLAQDFHVLLSDILPSLLLAMDRFCMRSNIAVSQNLEHGLKSLLVGTMNSHLLEYDASHISNLLVKWVMSWYRADESTSSMINMMLDNLKILIVQNPGRPLAGSALIPGFLVSRGFCNVDDTPIFHSTESDPLTFCMLMCPIETLSDENHNVEFQLPDPKDQEMVNRILGHKRQRTDEFLRRAKCLGINILLTTLQLSTLEKTLCSHYGISAIHTIPDDELNFISAMMNVEILSSTEEVSDSHVGYAKSCRQIVVGSHYYVNIECEPAHPCPSCLIVTGPTEGISHQVSSLIANSLKVIRGALVNHNYPHKESMDTILSGVSMENLSICSSIVRSSRFSEGGDSGICLTTHDQNTNVLSPLLASPRSIHANSDYHEEETTTNEYLYTVPVGGAFELALHEVICNYLSTQPAGAPGTTALSLLKESLLSIPQLIHTNAYYIAKPRWLSTLASAREVVSTGKAISIDASEGTHTRTTLTHSFSNKCQTLLKSLSTFHQLLKLDHVI